MRDSTKTETEAEDTEVGKYRRGQRMGWKEMVDRFPNRRQAAEIPIPS